MYAARETYAHEADGPRERHLKLLTDTIEAVNSTLDLEEVLTQVATKVADALHADACFVYLYDDRAGELVLRATHGTRVEEMTQRPRMRPGEGITGSAAESREPVMIAARANVDPRFKNFPNLPEDEYESILAVPILARGERLEGALNIRTREPRDVHRGRGRAAARDRRAGRPVDRAREAVRGGAAARARARGARPDLRGRLGGALSRGVARGDREDDDGRAPGDRGGALCSRTARSPGRRGRRTSTRSASRFAGAAARSASSSPTARRRSPSPTASCSRRSPSRRRSRSSTGGR